MCGRYTLRSNQHALHGAFPLFDIPELPPRYNICPTQEVAAIRAREGSDRPEFAKLRWGFLAPWAKSIKEKLQPINAKSETVAESRMFAKAFKTKRCLILADGFFEWVKAGERKQPMYIRLTEDIPFAFAGIWSQWQSKEDGEIVESCTILTTQANDLVRPIHERMPVILPPSAFEPWLDAKIQNPDELVPLLCPYAPDKMTTYPVSLTVNSPRNDVPQCIEPLSAA